MLSQQRAPGCSVVDRHCSVIDLITWNLRRKPQQSYKYTETDTQNALQLYLLILTDDGLRFDLLFEPKTHLFLLKSPFSLMSRFHRDTKDTPLKILSAFYVTTCQREVFTALHLFITCDPDWFHSWAPVLFCSRQPCPQSGSHMWNTKVTGFTCGSKPFFFSVFVTA